jgi:hypothetical protein
MVLVFYYFRSILSKIETGDLDPDRVGSGIQYGDASMRRARQGQNSSSGGGSTISNLKDRLPSAVQQNCGC